MNQQTTTEEKIQWAARGNEVVCSDGSMKLIVERIRAVPGAEDKLADQLADILNDPEELDYTTTVGQHGHAPARPKGKGWRLLHTTPLEARQVQWTWERPQRVAKLGG